jgi:hypothetical protein
LRETALKLRSFGRGKDPVMSRYLEAVDEPEATLDESTVALDTPEADNPDELDDVTVGYKYSPAS